LSQSVMRNRLQFESRTNQNSIARILFPIFKAYQISQFDKPICIGGHIELIRRNDTQYQAEPTSHGIRTQQNHHSDDPSARYHTWIQPRRRTAHGDSF
jgi:hypothetical protein